MNQLLEMHRHQKVILEALQPKNLVKLSRQLEQLQQIQRQELESRQEQEHERERISIIKNQKSPDVMRSGGKNMINYEFLSFVLELTGDGKVLKIKVFFGTCHLLPLSAT